MASPLALDLNRLVLEHASWAHVEQTVAAYLPRTWSPAAQAHAIADTALQLGQMDMAIRYYRESLRTFPQNIAAHENLIFLLDAQAETTIEEAAAERLRWWERFGRARYEQRTPHLNVRDPEKRLRVGYVSGDFRFHSAAFGCNHIIRSHSDQIEPVYYSTLPPAQYDQTTHEQWVAKVGPAWVDISPHSAAECARIFQADEIDILVDLSGYTAGNRLLAFAHKPAPIQITAWGYATGVGWPAMDVLFGDPLTMAGYPGPERVVHLPSVISFNPRPDLPEPGPLPCLSGPPIFSVFQRAMKLTRPVLETYAEILRRVPEATIVFKAADYSALAKTFIADCLPDARRQIQFLPSTTNEQHQVLYQQTDLALDPWPQTGGISTLEAAWNGVPTVTLIGPRIIQRASAAFMDILGLPQFIARSPQDYIAHAVYSVTDGRQELAAIRAGLRERLRTSRICVGYVEAVEARYRELWRAWCAT